MSKAIMNTAKLAELSFIRYAFSKGYTKKVVGDYAYTKSRKPNSPYIKMLSARNGKIQLIENGVRFELPICESPYLKVDKDNK